MLLKHLWIILIFLRPDATSSQQIKSGLSLILGRNSYELNEPVPLEGLTSDLWIHNRSQYEWEYGNITPSAGGKIFGLKYYADPRLRWRNVTPILSLVTFEDGMTYTMSKDSYYEEVNISHSANWRQYYVGFGVEAPLGRFVRLSVNGNRYFGTKLDAVSDFHQHRFRTKRNNFTSVGLSISLSIPSKIGEWRLSNTVEAGRRYINETFPMVSSSTSHFEIPLGFIHFPVTVLISEPQLKRSTLRYKLLKTESRFSPLITFREENNGVQEFTTFTSKVREGLGGILFFNLIFIENTKKRTKEMCLEILRDNNSWTSLSSVAFANSTLSHIAFVGDDGKAVYFFPEREYESQCGHLINREDLEHLIYSNKLKVEFHDVGYGIVIQVDNLTGIQQNWGRMYEGYLKERFETKS